MHDQVTAFGGHVGKSLGDGFLISFPSTVAAVRAAAAMQRSLSEHNTADPQRAVEIRIGINTGRVREREGDVSGQAVHAAAQVMDEAIGGQILTSDEVRKHAEPQLDWAFIDLGLFWLRGFPERWQLYEVSWNDASAGVWPRSEQARLTPSVEREAGRATHRRLLDDALSGHGRLASVAGEAINKSRLVTEIGDVAQARGMGELTGHCVEMSGGPPYLPYVEMIEQAISNPRRSLALSNALGNVAPEIARIAPALAARAFEHPATSPSCRSDWRAAMCGTASVSSSAAPRRPSRCCWFWKTSTGPTSRPCCYGVPGAVAARDAGAGPRNLPGCRSGSCSASGGSWPVGSPPAGGTDKPAQAFLRWRTRDAAGAGQAASA